MQMDNLKYAPIIPRETNLSSIIDWQKWLLGLCYYLEKEKDKSSKIMDMVAMEFLLLHFL